MTTEAAVTTEAAEAAEQVTAFLQAAHDLDVRLYRRVAGTSTPALDAPLRALSTAANYSRLSMAAAAAMALLAGPRGRRAAVSGLAAVAVTSAAANLGLKLFSRRPRPERELHGVLVSRGVPMPTSTSFPSGHTAAAVAFAEGVRHEWPGAGRVLYVVAGLVGYSRVHTGVHYPGDVLAGAALGLGTAEITSRAARRLRTRTEMGGAR